MARNPAHFWKVLALAALAAAAAAPGPSWAGGERRSKRLLVTFREGTSRAERAQAAKDMGLALSDDFDSIFVSVMEAAGDVSLQEVAKPPLPPSVVKIEEDVYRNWLLDAPSAVRPAGIAPWGVARVNAPSAWPSGQGQGVSIAVIDTGVDCSHPDLRCRPSDGVNLLDPSSPPMDDNEHGTHVSGIIAGNGAGGKGLLGVAPRAALVAVKVLDADGAGRLSDIVKGVAWATSAGVDVINLSLGGPGESAALKSAVDRALRAGVVVVAAAGNSGPKSDTVVFPASYPGVIAVAASDRQDEAASFSSRGGAVAFIAPGVDIASTVPGGGYKSLSGTSMAAPHVAGLAALAVERGARGPSGVRSAFLSAASRLCSISACLPPAAEGAGLIDASKLR